MMEEGDTQKGEVILKKGDNRDERFLERTGSAQI